MTQPGQYEPYIVTVEEALRLFDEASDYYTGKLEYLPDDSEIRDIAVRIFHSGYVSDLYKTCMCIFHVAALEFKRIHVAALEFKRRLAIHERANPNV